MKNLLFALVSLLSLNAHAYTFAGEIINTSGEEVTITVHSTNEASYTYECPQEKRFLGLKTISTFDLNLEKDSYYTLVFNSESENKMVYVDTHNIQSSDRLVCDIREYDSAIYYEPTHRQPKVSFVDRYCLQWLCETFPVVRDYNPQLMEMGEDIVDCTTNKDIKFVD